MIVAFFLCLPRGWSDSVPFASSVARGDRAVNEQFSYLQTYFK